MDRLVIERPQGYKENPDNEGLFGKATFYKEDSTAKEWVSLELQWANNANKISCIPEGEYQGIFKYSPGHGKNVYHVEPVDGRTDIEIHIANFAGNQALGWHKDLEGCITFGGSQGTLIPKETGRPQKAVLASGNAIREFENLAEGLPIQITIKESDNGLEISG